LNLLRPMVCIVDVGGIAVPEGEDAVLVSKVRQGNLGAFEALYEKYKTMVFRTAYAITRDRGGAEEVTQESFVRAFRSIQKVEARESLGPWLHRIAVNVSYNWWKASRRHWLYPLQSAIQAAEPLLADSPFRVAQQGEARNVLMEAIESLGFEQRVAVILFYLGDFSLEEIAYVLDCPVGTVKSRLYYGRLSLKRKLGQTWRTAPEVAYEF